MPSRRPRTLTTATTAALLAVLTLLAVVLTGPPGRAAVPATLPAMPTATTAAASSAGETTMDDGTLRDGWDDAEPGLTPAAVESGDFGELFATKVQGQVYGQPLLVDASSSNPGVLVVATEDDYIYGLNPIDGSVLWHTQLGQFWSASVLGCADLTPDLGITSTPVFDPSTDTLYVMANTAPDGATSSDPVWQLHALDPHTGAERAGWPAPISGSPSNDPAHPFDPKTAAQRPGLLLLDGAVYAGFGSYCDYDPYVGYVVGVSTTTAKVTAMWSTEAGTNDGGAGIWQAGGGLVSDGPGQILVATGNGDVTPLTASASPAPQASEAVLRLAVQADGSLVATDWFSPADRDNLDANDTDLGSGGPIGIPDGYGTASHPHLLVDVGKEGVVYLLDRDHLGGYAQGAGGGDDVLDSVGLANGVWGHSAFWGGTPGTTTAGGYVYVPMLGPLTALKLSSDASGNPTLLPVATSTMNMGYTCGSPVVTSDGTTAGTALVWDESFDTSTGTHPMLRAFAAQPDNGTLDEVFKAPLNPPGVTDGSQAHGSKFATVATYGGRVYTGTRDGYVFGFGQPSAAPLTSPPIDLGNVPVGQTSAPVDATLTATRAVTVDHLDTTGPYAVGATNPVLPAQLAAGQSLTAEVTMTPTAPGDQSGTLTAATEDASYPTVAFGLSGYGTQAGLVADPATLDFGQVAVGNTARKGVTVLNASVSDLTVQSVTGPSGAFSSSALPQHGQLIPAQSSFAIPVTYQPKNPGSDGSTLGITLTNGSSLTVPLTSTAVVAHPHLALQPPTLNFGLVPRGHTVTKTFQLTNTGNVALTVTKAKAPYDAFRTDQPLGEGKQISPDTSVVQPVTFSPLTPGRAVSRYLVTVDDNHGPHYERLVGTDDQLTDRYDGSAALRRLLSRPLGPTRTVQGGYRRWFAHGVMYWSGTGGVHDVRGAVLRRYRALGGAHSWLGFPTGDTARVGARWRQTFRHGTISCTADGRCRATRG